MTFSIWIVLVYIVFSNHTFVAVRLGANFVETRELLHLAPLPAP